MGGNFRGVHHFWGDPYLYTTVLFDDGFLSFCNFYRKCAIKIL